MMWVDRALTDTMGPAKPVPERVPGLDEADWWLEYGLDGLIGALLGGLLAGAVAWWAVRRTIQHERDLSVESREQGSLAGLRASVVAAQAKVIVLGFEDDTKSAKARMIEAYTVTINLAAEAEPVSPALAADLTAWPTVAIAHCRSKDDPKMLDDAALSTHLTELQVRLSMWLRDADAYARGDLGGWVAEGREIYLAEAK